LSAKLENQIVSPATAHAPPPYSWTRVRTLNGAGVTTRGAPSAPSSITALRPPSCGRLCSHNARSPAMRGAPTGRTPAATRPAEMVDGQVPNGRVAGDDMEGSCGGL